MSAICGSIDLRNHHFVRDECAAILRAQRRYGTGRPNIRQVDGASFGIDLFATVSEDCFDRQPLLIDGQLLVADVRLDNRDELISSLGLKRDEARDSADSEIVLRSWIRWGETCLDRIVGDFAFALFDSRKQKLHLARDCAGERPLFFASDMKKIAFASMPSGILSLPEFRRGFDLDSLACAAADFRPLGDRTYFEAIRRVLPGQLVTFGTGCLRVTDYWKPSREELSLANEGEYVEAYRSILDAAVKPRLRRLTEPVAAHLSSGFDSSAVASTAARLSLNEQLIAFTAAPAGHFNNSSPRGRIADESEGAALTAQRHTMQHLVVRTGGSGLSHIKSLVATSQEPHCNIINLGWANAIERRARDEGARILLSGEFGNLTLNAGGLNVLADLIAGNHWLKWWSEARQAAMQRDVHWRGVLINSFEPWLPRPMRLRLYRWRFASGRRLDSVFLRKEPIFELGDRLERAFLPDRSTDSYEDRKHFLRLIESGTLRKGSLARHGVDNRSPLGDRRIIEFSLRLPREKLFANGISKPLARAALADRVPAEVLSQQNRGYQAADWFETINLAEVTDMIEEIAANSIVRELIDIGKLRRAIDGWPRQGFERFGVYQQLAGDLPAALATGLFIVEAEKWLAGKLD